MKQAAISNCRYDYAGGKRCLVLASVSSHKEYLGDIYKCAVWTVDGEVIRNEVDVNFTDGGNPVRYGYVPNGELWIEDKYTPKDMAATLYHEAVEMFLMEHSELSYDIAHEMAAEVESKFRMSDIQVDSRQVIVPIVDVWFETWVVQYMNKIHKIVARHEKQAGMFEGPPAIETAMREWMFSVYAGHVLYSVLVELKKLESTDEVKKDIQKTIDTLRKEREQLSGNLDKLDKGQTHRITLPQLGDVPRWSLTITKDEMVTLAGGEPAYTMAVNRKPLMFGMQLVKEVVLKGAEEHLERQVRQRMRAMESLDLDGVGESMRPVNLKNLNELKAECLRYTTKPKRYTGRAAKVFPIDVTGWKYIQANSPMLQTYNKNVKDFNAKLDARIQDAKEDLKIAQKIYDDNIDNPNAIADWQPGDKFIGVKERHYTNFWSSWRIKDYISIKRRPDTVMVSTISYPALFKVGDIRPIGEAKELYLVEVSPDEINKVLEKKPSITAILSFVPHKTRGGVWRLLDMELEVDVPVRTPSYVSGFNDVLYKIETTLKHEVRHVGQDVLRWVKELEEDAGLPSKHIRDVNVTPYGYSKPLNKNVDHALRDVEFYTDLGDVIRYFIRSNNNTPSKNMREAFLSYIGYFARNPISFVSPFFSLLKEKAPDKWRKAVGVFYMELKKKGIDVGTKTEFKKTKIAERVAARYKDKKKIKNKDGEESTVYVYSEKQVQYRDNEKAKRIEKLRGKIDDLIKQVEKDLKSEASEKNKTWWAALAVKLIDCSFERVGNSKSADDGHYGVTGWKKKHVTFSKGKAVIKYVGKSGVDQEKHIDDSICVKMLKEAVEGKKPEDEVVDCTAEDVNAYLKPFDVTAKDIRGLHANQLMQEHLKAVRKKGGALPEDKKEREKQLKDEFKEALELAAEEVGHGASTLKNLYLVPGIFENYIKDGTIVENLAKQKKTATKTPAQKEDERVEELSKPAPKSKPPRYDLRNERVEEKDKDTEAQGADGDKDLSLNYKRVANRYLRSIIAEGEKCTPQPGKGPGDVWKGKGKKWRGWKSERGCPQVFDNKDDADVYVKGGEPEEDDEPVPEISEPEVPPEEKVTDKTDESTEQKPTEQESESEKPKEKKPDQPNKEPPVKKELPQKAKPEQSQVVDNEEDNEERTKVKERLRDFLSSSKYKRNKSLDEDKVVNAYLAAKNDIEESFANGVEESTIKALGSVSSQKPPNAESGLGEYLARQDALASHVMSEKGILKYMPLIKNREAIEMWSKQVDNNVDLLTPAQADAVGNALVEAQYLNAELGSDESEDGRSFQSYYKVLEDKGELENFKKMDVSEQNEKLKEIIMTADEKTLKTLAGGDSLSCVLALDSIRELEAQAANAPDEQGKQIYQACADFFKRVNQNTIQMHLSGLAPTKSRTSMLKKESLLARKKTITSDKIITPLYKLLESKKDPKEKDKVLIDLQNRVLKAVWEGRSEDYAEGYHPLYDSDENEDSSNDQRKEVRDAQRDYEIAHNLRRLDALDVDQKAMDWECILRGLEYLAKGKYAQNIGPGCSITGEKTAGFFGSKKNFQCFPYKDSIISRGACPFTYDQVVKEKPKGGIHMAKLTKKGALSVTSALDRLANLFQAEAGTLGVPAKIACDFAYRCDLLSDHIEKQAAENLNPPLKLDYPSDSALNMDNAVTGEEKAGPLEQIDSDEPWMGGEFTQQENRELREKFESGTLSKGKPNFEPLAPQAGKQAADKIGEAADLIQGLSIKYASSKRLAYELSNLATSLMGIQLGVLDNTVSATKVATVLAAVNKIMPAVQSVKASTVGNVVKMASLVSRLAKDDKEMPDFIKEKIEEGKEDKKEEKKAGEVPEQLKPFVKEKGEDKDEKKEGKKASHGFNLQA
jgi:DNA topoisomerase-1